MKATIGGAAALAALSGLRVANAAEESQTSSESSFTNDIFSGQANARQIADDLWWVGASDKRLALFENAYPLEHGVAYNSYLLLDEQVVLIDTVDRSVTGQFFENLEAVLAGRKIDYLVVNHMEPDHSSAISQVLSRFPEATVVTTAAAAALIQQFFGLDISNRSIIAAEGDTLTIGKHTLAFVEAPMVHWPEVMMTFDATNGVLFSADAFGTFNALDGNIYADQVNFTQDEQWLAEARRYYCNIVGKYGQNVQDVLAKASTLDISMFCSTHGPIWRQDLDWILDKYSKWSSYTPEDDAVAIFYGSIYGGTENAANILAAKLSDAGVSNVKVYDVSKTHVSWLIAEAFRCSHLVFASATYNMGIFTNMKNFLNDLVAHNMQNRHVSFIENGSWSPAAGQLMKDIVAQMPNMTEVGTMVTLRSTTSEANVGELETMAQAIAVSLAGDDSAAAAVEASGDNADVSAGTVGGAEGDQTQQAAPAEGSSDGEAAASDSADAASTGTTRKWRCKVCGHIYEGEELPADYVCPICGVGADQFEEITE